jgi:hypothetical protein
MRGRHISRHLENIPTFCRHRITNGAFSGAMLNHEHHEKDLWALENGYLKTAIHFYVANGLCPRSF